MQKKRMNKIGIAAVITALLVSLTVSGFRQDQRENAAYEHFLFDDSYVHTIDITCSQWEKVISEASLEHYVLCTITIDDEQFQNVGIRAKGNNSLRLNEEYGLSRFSLKLKFDFMDERFSYHGLDKFSLDASFQDNSYMKTILAFDMMRYMEVPAPLCSYVWVRVNGADWGLFLAVEEGGPSFVRRNFGNDHGVLYQPDYRSLQDENADVALRYTDDSFKSYANIFDNAKTAVTVYDKKRLIRTLKKLPENDELSTILDVDEILRYFSVQVFVMNWDSYLGMTGHNYLLYEEDGLLQMLPWDYNLAFATYPLGMSDPLTDAETLINYPIDTPLMCTSMEERPVFYELMKEADCLRQYHEYLAELHEGYFSSGRFETKMKMWANLIDEYVKQDPTAYCSYADHLEAVDMLEKICLLRSESIQRQLERQIPSTMTEQNADREQLLDCSDVDIQVLGDFEDLEKAGHRQDQALQKVLRSNK